MSRTVVDASAIVAVLNGEPGAEQVLAALAQTGDRSMPATSVVEAGMALNRFFGSEGRRRLDNIITDWRLQVVPFTAEHAERALDAWERYGRTSGHPAKLSFGDCCTYATAEIANADIIYVGNDFSEVPSPRRGLVVDMTWPVTPPPAR